ncbi:hypothetical protein Dimus_022466 [Dionaea muscipula]
MLAPSLIMEKESPISRSSKPLSAAIVDGEMAWLLACRWWVLGVFGGDGGTDGDALTVESGGTQGFGGAQREIETGDAMISTMDSDEVQCSALDKLSISPAPLEDSLIDGSDMQVADVPHSASLTPLLSGSVSPAGVGLVSEEGQVLPVAREAVRPQPTDWLRQPPSSPVKPVIGTEGGVG